MNKNALLIIDPQNSFCNPGNSKGTGKGSLYVPGADRDMLRLAKWIKGNKVQIDHIIMTADAHQPNDISHQGFWMNKKGNPPPPFTVIMSKDVIDGKWIAKFEPKRALKYLKDLEKQGEYPHIIWPDHCINGSEGAAIYKPLLDAVLDWTKGNKFYQIITKGLYPFSEHFGAFQAQVPDSKYLETQLNTELLKTLNSYKNVYLAGEAKSHCVANCLKQVMDAMPKLAARFTVLEDTMSDVPGFEKIATSIYTKARELGVKFCKTSKCEL